MSALHSQQLFQAPSAASNLEVATVVGTIERLVVTQVCRAFETSRRREVLELRASFIRVVTCRRPRAGCRDCARGRPRRSRGRAGSEYVPLVERTHLIKSASMPTGPRFGYAWPGTKGRGRLRQRALRSLMLPWWLEMPRRMRTPSNWAMDGIVLRLRRTECMKSANRRIYEGAHANRFDTTPHYAPKDASL